MTIITIINIIITAIEFSLGDSSPYTSTDKTNNVHKEYKNTVQTIRNSVDTSAHITKTPPHNKNNTYRHPHITNFTPTHTHTLQTSHLNTPTHYKINTNVHQHFTKSTHPHFTKSTHTHTHT